MGSKLCAGAGMGLGGGEAGGEAATAALFAFIIIGGAFHGLVFLPVALSLVGWDADPGAPPAHRLPAPSRSKARAAERAAAAAEGVLDPVAEGAGAAFSKEASLN